MQLTLLALALAGCADLTGYAGEWSGAPVSDPALLGGLAAETRARLQVDAVDRVSLRGALTVGGETIPLRPVQRAANDTLGALELPDAPLRSYLMVAPLAGGDALAVVSLYQDHVDVRLLRSDALYAVYHLRR